MSDEIHKRVKRFQEQLGEKALDEYYVDTASRIDTVFGEVGRKWLRVIEAKKEYDALAEAVPIGQGFLTFYDYIKEYYGIKLQMDGDNFGPNYDVIDEKKYTVFLLKFGNGN